MKNSKKRKRRIVRDAKTGQFVRSAEAERRPETTVTETVEEQSSDEKQD